MMLQTIFENGKIVTEFDFEQVKANINEKDTVSC